jgi:hypothetical protein
LVVLLLPPGLVTLRVWSTLLALKPVIVQPAGVVRMALPATKLRLAGSVSSRVTVVVPSAMVTVTV